MSSDDYRPRLSIVLTDEQRQKLNKLLPWGSGNILFNTIIDELIVILEEYGHAAIGLIVSKKVSMLDLMRISEQKRLEGSSGPVQPKAKKPRRPINERADSDDSET